MCGCVVAYAYSTEYGLHTVGHSSTQEAFVHFILYARTYVANKVYSMYVYMMCVYTTHHIHDNTYVCM